MNVRQHKLSGLEKNEGALEFPSRRELELDRCGIITYCAAGQVNEKNIGNI